MNSDIMSRTTTVDPRLLRRTRVAAGFTLTEVERFTRIERSDICRFEIGERFPRPEMTVRWASGLRRLLHARQRRLAMLAAALDVDARGPA
jgi:transcriptional regulator with XRE-family HTH domain